MLDFNELMSDRQIAMEIFKEIPISHGEIFDDGRRWCAGCERPQLACDPVLAITWKQRACPSCSAIWPEYTMQFMQDVESGDGDFDDLEMVQLH